MTGKPASSDISFHYVSDNLSNQSAETESIAVAVTIPTFRRPEHLLKTLKSVEAQQTNRKFVCIVMENDPDDGSGAEVAKAFFSHSTVSGIVINAHRRGNCSAYNAGWFTALGRFKALRWIMVIDDDECAEPHWIEKMTASAETLGVDMVGAPQTPLFIGNVNEKRTQHPVFKPAHEISGKVPILYSSGNVLIGTNVLRKMGYPYLDEKFNFIGGGDYDFYTRCRHQGFTFGWEADAPVIETIPDRRTEISWLNARGLRNGAISTMIEKRTARGFAGKLKIISKSLLMLGMSPFKALTLFAKTGSPVIGIYPVNIAVGRLLVEFGFANEQYRDAEKN